MKILIVKTKAHLSPNSAMKAATELREIKF